MSELKKPAGATHSRKRKGRGSGSGLGTTAGRGTKGQNSRSGGHVRPGFEGGQMPIYRRTARRGFSNYPFRKDVVGVNVRELERAFEGGQEVTWDALVASGIVKRSEREVKILAEGDLTKSFTVRGLAVSGAAKAKIEAAGGTVVISDETSNDE